MSSTEMTANAPWLGVIADDFTGASDVAGTLVSAGMRVVQTFGVPNPSMQLHDVDCIVVSLKTRSAPAADAVEESLAAARALKSRGVQQLYFKYCSTFDSTPEGNIGPVADALLVNLSPPARSQSLLPEPLHYGGPCTTVCCSQGRTSCTNHPCAITR
jgi:3-dehydrotetronate 4-kinase